MITSVTKQLFYFLRQPTSLAFSTYKVKGDSPFRSVTQENKKYTTQDAERAYKEYLEE